MATATYTCRHHPTLRWTKGKCGPGYMGRGVLRFLGEIGGLEASPINMTENTLSARSEEFQQWYREKYVPECDCPFRDLVVIEMVPDHPRERPFAPWSKAPDGTWINKEVAV